MVDVDLDINEDVEARDGGGIDGYQAAVTVVNEEIGAESNGGEVVDATGTVGDVTEDKAVRDASEGGEDVGEDERVHEQALGELEGHALRPGGQDAPDAFVNLEVVVGREDGYGGVEKRVVED